MEKGKIAFGTLIGIKLNDRFMIKIESKYMRILYKI